MGHLSIHVPIRLFQSELSMLVFISAPCLPQVLFGEASVIAARKRTILLLLVTVLACYTEV